MRNSGKIFLSAIIIALVSISCTKDKMDNFADSVVSYKQYMPMKAGEVSLYRMDSIVPTAFGVQLNTISYIVKDTIVAQRLDAVGDTTFDVSRFITDTLQTQPWTLATAYQVVYTKNTGDLIQADGKRFIKLTTPVRNGYAWDGNQYFISGDNQSSSDPNWMYFGWNYVYDSVGMSYQIGGRPYNNTVVINEINNIQPFDPDLYSTAYYAQEIYAEGVGLVYQNMLFYIYQPASGSSAGYDLSSFGIRLTRMQ